MKEAWMLPIQPKWVDMIRSGVKEFEFRPYPLEGKVYIYESLGVKTKSVLTPEEQASWWNAYHDKEEHLTKEDFTFNALKLPTGAGAIVGEFVVEECYEIRKNKTSLGDVWFNYYYKGLITGKEIVIRQNDIGWDKQKYAIKISQLKFYDKPIPKEEFVSYSKYQKMLNRTIIKCSKLDGCKIFNETDCTLCPQALKENDCYVTHGPQRAIKVVER